MDILAPLMEDYCIANGPIKEDRKSFLDYMMYSEVVNKALPKKLFFPYYYDFVNVDDSSVLLDEIKCTNDKLTPVGEVVVNRPYDGTFPIFDKKILNMAGG